MCAALDVIDADIAKPDMTDQAFLTHRGDSRILLVARHRRIDPVQLPQIDTRDAKPAQAHHHALTQIFRPPQRPPRLRARPGEAAFRRDHHVFVRMQDLADEILADERAIGIRRVDEIDAEFRQQTQSFARRGGIGRIAPDAFASQPHGAEAEAVDCEIAADLELACAGSGRLC